MKFSAIKCATIVALTAFTLTAHGAVAQPINQQLNPQIKVSPGVQAVKPNDSTQAEHLKALQAQVNQLVAEVNSLKSQIATLQKDTVAANFKSAAAVLWVNNYGESSKQAGIWVQANGVKASVAGTSFAEMDSAVKKLMTHTHRYDLIQVSQKENGSLTYMKSTPPTEPPTFK